jgi:hypothetical protein
VLIQAQVHGPGGGTPIQVLGEDGRVSRGIGVTSARPLRSGVSIEGFRKLAKSIDGGVWSAYLNRYEASHFDIEGNETDRLVRVSDWFRPYEAALEGELFFVPQRPRIEGLAQDSDGLLWIVASHGARDFTPLGEATAGEVAVDAFVDFSEYLDTTIEVIDLRRGVVLARTVVPEHLKIVRTPDGDVLFHATVVTPTGDLAIRVFRPEVASTR